MLTKTPLYRVWKNTLSRSLKKKRLKLLLDITGFGNDNRKIKVLELGCANGMDALQFLQDSERYELYGADLVDRNIPFQNFTFIQCDAEKLPFEDNYFDLVITIGLLEHIEPIEKLSSVVKEIHRVGKAYANIVPSISTFVEPHTVKPFWSLKLHKHFVHKYSEKNILHLNFFSDHTWSKFEGFMNADIKRFYYLFPFIKNTVIYKKL